MNFENVTVVIRSVGERTEYTCRELLSSHFLPEQIVVARNAPFSATLADAYRAGIERGRRWTLCIDADVLPTCERLQPLLQRAEQTDRDVCEIQGLVLDKFFGVTRHAGNHLYRTSHLPLALELLRSQGRQIRPEHTTLSRMAERGHPWIEVPLVLGLHDFEQFDRDIFRKCCVHARKFDAHMHLLIRYWRERAADDSDFKVALAGLAAGIVETTDVDVDVRRDFGFFRWVATEGRSEKSLLPCGSFPPAHVNEILETWPSPAGELADYGAYNRHEIVHGSASSRSPRNAWFDTLPRTMGQALGTAGRRLARLTMS